MTQEFFFTLSLTENEHDFVDAMVREKCQHLGMKFHYYRKFKEGHVPMQREVKVEGTRLQIAQFRAFLEDEYIHIGNYHSKAKELERQVKAGEITPMEWLEKMR